MKRTAEEIARFVGGQLYGDRKTIIESVASLPNAGPGDLTYAEEKYLDRVPESRAACILVSQGEYPGQTVIVVDDAKVTFVRAATWLLPSEQSTPGVHPTAIISPGAVLGDGVAIGAWTVVESGATIGDHTVLFPGCYIGKNSKVGSSCVLYPRVVVYRDVEISDRVIVHAGVVIGADGFGFVYDGSRHLKFPQVGKVVIEDDVEIGANTCIDRGSLETTVVGRGAKIDNLCQIAHNVRIGEHTVIAAQTGVSGSSTVGSHAIIGGQVGIADHCRVDSHAIIGAQCGVPSGKRVRSGEVFWGTPARPLKDIKVQQAYLARLPKLAEEVEELKNVVNKLQDSTAR